MLIFDVWCDRLGARLAAKGVAGGNVDANRSEPTRDEELPFCVVYIAGDKAEPDGDANMGVPDYVHVSQIVVEVIHKAASGPALKTALYTDAQRILDVLLSDHSWWQDQTADADAEALGRFDVKYDTPPEGEMIVGRVQVALDVRHRTTWPPVITDDLAVLHLTTPVTGDRTAPIQVESRIEPAQEE